MVRLQELSTAGGGGCAACAQEAARGCGAACSPGAPAAASGGNQPNVGGTAAQPPRGEQPGGGGAAWACPSRCAAGRGGAAGVPLSARSMYCDAPSSPFVHLLCHARQPRARVASQQLASMRPSSPALHGSGSSLPATLLLTRSTTNLNRGSLLNSRLACRVMRTMIDWA